MLPRLEADRPVFDFFPTTNVDEYVLMWEQRDNYVGLQQVRGLNGEFSKVRRVAVDRYTVEPGVYGEFEPIDEAMLTMRRQIGTFAQAIDISDLVMPIQDQLLQRRLDRIEWMIWTLLNTGTFSVAAPDGAILHTDSYPTQVYTAGVPWANIAAATPMYDFRQVSLLARGHSVSFGADSQAFMNLATFNFLSRNDNAADIYGRRVAGLATANNLKDINGLLQGDNLPEICVYDRGYYDDTATGAPTNAVSPSVNPLGFHTFIPDNLVVVIGKRPGNQPVGDFAYTRNANNPDLGPGPFMFVQDTMEETGKPPRNINVYDGFSGGIRLYFPSAIVIMQV